MIFAMISMQILSSSPVSLLFQISTPMDLFHSHHEAIGDGADVSLAFVGLHSALSLFNSSAFLLLLPGWPALDMGGDAIGEYFLVLIILCSDISLTQTSGKLAALRMLVVHGNAFAVAASASIQSETSTHGPVPSDISAILLGTRSLLRLYPTPLLCCLFIFSFGSCL